MFGSRSLCPECSLQVWTLLMETARDVYASKNDEEEEEEEEEEKKKGSSWYGIISTAVYRKDSDHRARQTDLGKDKYCHTAHLNAF